MCVVLCLIVLRHMEVTGAPTRDIIAARMGNLSVDIVPAQAPTSVALKGLGYLLSALVTN